MGKTKPETSTSILWPTEFTLVPGNPLPTILVIGDVGRGKSTFLQSIAPTRPGQQPRTLVLDTEQSHTTLALQFGGQVIDLRREAGRFIEQAKGDLELALFMAFWEQFTLLRSGGSTYDVIAIETMSDLYFGAYKYVGIHQELYKPMSKYSGEMGNMSQWSDGAKLLKQMTLNLSELCKTVVWGAHVKDERDKGKNLTGRKALRGLNIKDAFSLVVWLFDDRDTDPNGKEPGKPGFNGKRWAYVEKQRLDYVYYPDGSDEPKMRPLLPRKLIPAQGQTFPALIREYMRTPLNEAVFEDLDKVENDPTRQEDETDRQNREMALLEARRQEALAAEKRSMIARLVHDGIFTSNNAVIAAVTGNPDYAELTGTSDGLVKLETALRQAANGQQA